MGLLQSIGNSSLQFRFSVIAHAMSKKSKVIIQDISPTGENINGFLKEIYREILEFENLLLQDVNTDIFSTFATLKRILTLSF